MKITWYGHSCFKIESEYGSAVFDPYADGSVPGLELPRGITADAVICSHEHSDHNARELVTLTGREPDFSVRAVETYHDHAHGEKRGKNTISVVTMGDISVAHLGDLGHPLSREQVEAIGEVDVLLLPVGGYYTIDAREALEAADALGARVVVPMHYRGDGFGYDVITTAEDFLALRSGEIEFLSGNTLEVHENERRRTVVFSL